MDLNEMQKEVWQNKINKGFNLTNVEKEFAIFMAKLVTNIREYVVSSLICMERLWMEIRNLHLRSVH